MSDKKKELEELVEERKQEALSKNIFDKARIVCQYLGKNNGSSSGRYTPNRSFYKSKKFLIETWGKHNGSYTRDVSRIIYGEDTVFFGGRYDFESDGTSKVSVDCYIPGSWMLTFESLVKKAQMKYERIYSGEAKLEFIAHGKEEGLKKRFGL